MNPFRFNGLEAYISTNTMNAVYDIIADTEVREIRNFLTLWGLLAQLILLLSVNIAFRNDHEMAMWQFKPVR